MSNGIYRCDLCALKFTAEVPTDTETNQDVACPTCHQVDTHFTGRESHVDSKPGKGRKERFG